MKVAILAGGLGSRLGEETSIKPKPMVEIGGRPIIWHIMKTYAHYGFTEFVVMCGYKSECIKNYFLNYRMNNSDISVNLENGNVRIESSECEPWKITLCETGEKTMTGGRIARAKKYLQDEPFMLTYGDGVADVNIDELIKSHKKSGKIATVTAVRPTERFGILNIGQDSVLKSFTEKPADSASWINGGFFVLEPKVFDYIEDSPDCVWERAPLSNLAKDGQINAYKHCGFWRPMDMLKDKKDLNEIWNAGNAPWKVWQ